MKLSTLPRTLWVTVVFLLFSLALAPGPIQASGSQGAYLHLRAAHFDPLAIRPYRPDGDAQAHESAGLYLVQFNGPVQPAWKEAVQAAGARLYGYVPDWAYLAKMDAATAEQFTGLQFVRWVGPYLPVYRLAPVLQAAAALPQAGDPAIEVAVQTLPDADLPGLAQALAAWGAVARAQSANSLAGYLQVSLPVSRLEALAGQAGVVWVEPFLPPTLMNDIGGEGILRAGPVRQSLQLTGSGQIIAIADSGVDTGLRETLHPDLRRQVYRAYCLGRPSPCDWSDYMGHGTHVTGSAVGGGDLSGSQPAGHQYSGSYAGVAPEAIVIFQSLADGSGYLSGIPADMGDLLRTTYADGARIHSNSWGSLSSGVYTIQSQQVDTALWELPHMLAFFAAGNGGTDADHDGRLDSHTLASPASAKNVVAVGASESTRPTVTNTWGTRYPEPIASDPQADNAAGMAPFSSQGPTDDGRVKPDVVAPGTYIVSTRSQQFVFKDDLEGETGGYTFDLVSGGTGPDRWALDGDAHSGGQAWLSTIQGDFTPGAQTVLLTPAVDVRPTGTAFTVSFWHKYRLSQEDRLVVSVLDPVNGVYGSQVLNLYGSQEGYAYTQVTLSLANYFSPPAPSVVKIGLAIQSGGAGSDSAWWVDDLRVSGNDWGTLSSIDLAAVGSPNDEAYTLMGGTSMSTPLTAGAAALVRQWLVEQRGQGNPTGAILKALLLNGAARMTPGQYTAEAYQEIPAQHPNLVNGWGRVDLVGSLDPPLPAQVWFDDHQKGLATGEKLVTELVVRAPTQPGEARPAGPLSVTLAWTDYPGQPYTSLALVNDLDLEVIAPDGAHYYGNSGVYTGGACLRDGKWDTCNNVETVAIPAPAYGVYKVRVIGYHIPEGPQAFALAASGTCLLDGPCAAPVMLYLPTVYR